MVKSRYYKVMYVVASLTSFERQHVYTAFSSEKKDSYSFFLAKKNGGKLQKKNLDINY